MHPGTEDLLCTLIISIIILMHSVSSLKKNPQKLQAKCLKNIPRHRQHYTTVEETGAIHLGHVVIAMSLPVLLTALLGPTQSLGPEYKVLN